MNDQLVPPDLSSAGGPISICVIATSPIPRDGRVLRLVKALASCCRVTVIGYGDAPPEMTTAYPVHWKLKSQQLPLAPPPTEEGGKGPLAILARKYRTFRRLLRNRQLLPQLWRYLVYFLRLRALLRYTLVAACHLRLSRLFPGINYMWYWQLGDLREFYGRAVEERHDAYYANDWNTLPLAGKAAKKMGAKLVFDDHEYAPMEHEYSWQWRFTTAPLIRAFLNEYISSLDGFIVVNAAIADRYLAEFGRKPIVVMNVPESEAILPLPTDPSSVLLVHHGTAGAARRLELLIETMPLCDERFTLHFYLLSSDLAYLESLRKLADSLAPGRVHFHATVSPAQLVREISQYAIGLCYVAPTCWQYIYCLPNKFFESLAAGLAVIAGPMPAVAALIKEHGVGLVTETYEPREIAARLNALTAEEIDAMRARAHAVAPRFHASTEVAKVLGLLQEIFPGRVSVPKG